MSVNLRAVKPRELICGQSDTRRARVHEDVIPSLHFPYFDKGLIRCEDGEQKSARVQIQMCINRASVAVLARQCRSNASKVGPLPRCRGEAHIKAQPIVQFLYIPVNQFSGMLAASTQERCEGFRMT